MQQLHCIISGRVQGVAFRNFVKELAFDMRITGIVTNLPDGSIEVVAQGEYTVLQVFLTHLIKGPPGAIVTGAYDEWVTEPKQKFEGFKVVEKSQMI